MAVIVVTSSMTVVVVIMVMVMIIVIIILSLGLGLAGRGVDLDGSVVTDEGGKVLQRTGPLVLHGCVLLVGREVEDGGESSDVQLGRNLAKVKDVGRCAQAHKIRTR